MNDFLIVGQSTLNVQGYHKIFSGRRGPSHWSRWEAIVASVNLEFNSLLDSREKTAIGFGRSPGFPC